MSDAHVEAAGGGPEHVVRLTWYVTDKQDYLAHQAEVEDDDLVGMRAKDAAQRADLRLRAAAAPCDFGAIDVVSRPATCEPCARHHHITSVSNQPVASAALIQGQKPETTFIEDNDAL